MDDNKSQREITKYADVVKRFLSHYYYAIRKAPDPKQVAEVVFESIKMSVASANRGNFFRYPVGEDAKFYLEAKKKMNDSELHSLVAQRTLSITYITKQDTIRYMLTSMMTIDSSIEIMIQFGLRNSVRGVIIDVTILIRNKR